MNEKPTTQAEDQTPPALGSDGATAEFVPGRETVADQRVRSVGARFGRYLLLRLLGKGGMGEVHLAQDTLLERTVALKLPRFADDDTLGRERFLREAKAAAVLQHPNICPVYDVGEEAGRPYLTMAFVDGPSLAQRLQKEGPFAAAEAARLVAQAARAMQTAHEHGILHRDLKPSNILLNPHDEPVIMDFGLAYRFDADTDDRLTHKGMIVGTPAYMPPEQVNGAPLGPTADVYSLGVVLYELLTGRVPFTGALGQLLGRIEIARPPAPSSVQPGIDPRLEAICLKALSKRPGDRFLDMAAFARALEDHVAGKGAASGWRRWGVALGGGVGLIAAVVVIFVAVNTRQPEASPSPSGTASVAPLETREALVNRLLEQMAKPILKVGWKVGADRPEVVARANVPAELLKDHPGPLFFMVQGGGGGHVVDLGDQLGQTVQVSEFAAGDVTLLDPCLVLLRGLSADVKIRISGRSPYCLLIAVEGGAGCRHVEYGGTHIVLTKKPPAVEIGAASAEEAKSLSNPKLTHKVTLRWVETQYVIYTSPDVQITPGDVGQRERLFPAVHNLIEHDKTRQLEAHTISDVQVREARKK